MSLESASHESNCYKCKKIIVDDSQSNLSVACENESCKKILCKACQPKNFHLSDDWLCETHENKCSDSNAKDISLEYLDRFLKRHLILQLFTYFILLFV